MASKTRRQSKNVKPYAIKTVRACPCVKPAVLWPKAAYDVPEDNEVCGNEWSRPDDRKNNPTDVWRLFSMHSCDVGTEPGRLTA